MQIHLKNLKLDTVCCVYLVLSKFVTILDIVLSLIYMLLTLNCKTVLSFHNWQVTIHITLLSSDKFSSFIIGNCISSLFRPAPFTAKINPKYYLLSVYNSSTTNFTYIKFLYVPLILCDSYYDAFKSVVCCVCYYRPQSYLCLFTSPTAVACPAFSTLSLILLTFTFFRLSDVTC